MEYKLRPSNLLQRVKRIIIFADHAPCHKTKNVKKLIRERRSVLRVKLLPKKAPNLNPVERLVDKQVSRLHEPVPLGPR
ncbi:MAG: transposase [Nitrososphaerota archaeon]|jgi:transposase|nr:transposase [Nitrososphaerota archaeon]MDG6956729.1 transposase [Nitrososphaerota archaeon]MDG6959456.1 transposase [Nitrososphaerota archaeon]MDG6968030.1 transposase [Nitrososphaerota archaeon]MDG6969315.1 transposase [Nitrososphaerota archaeon]